MILNLNLKKEHFDNHQSIKKHEYRSITPYWCERLVLWTDGKKKPRKFWEEKSKKISLARLIIDNNLNRVNYSYVRYLNGMKGNGQTPHFTKKYFTLRIGIGKKEWGAVPNEVCFILNCGLKLYRL